MLEEEDPTYIAIRTLKHRRGWLRKILSTLYIPISRLTTKKTHKKLEVAQYPYGLRGVCANKKCLAWRSPWKLLLQPSRNLPRAHPQPPIYAPRMSFGCFLGGHYSSGRGIHWACELALILIVLHAPSVPMPTGLCFVPPLLADHMKGKSSPKAGKFMIASHSMVSSHFMFSSKLHTHGSPNLSPSSSITASFIPKHNHLLIFDSIPLIL